MQLFTSILRSSVWLCSAALVLSACGGGSSSHPQPMPSMTGITPSSQPSMAPSPTTTIAPDPQAFICPNSDTTLGHARGGLAMNSSIRRMTPRRSGPSAAVASQLLAVTYDAGTLAAGRAGVAEREAALGARLSHEYTFANTGRVTRVLNVPSAQITRVSAALRQQLGVRSVGLTGSRRYSSAVTQPYFPNDPYFTGFTTTNPPPSGGAAPPSTFKSEPLVESADVPGQWDMHVIGLESAFGYSQPNNGSSIVNSSALGLPTVKIAVIDTGEDATHPELASKIAYQRCYITSPSNFGGAQSTSNYSSDGDGHGTNVTGIAAAASNNNLGYTGAGGNVSIAAYRVFPRPNDDCSDPTSMDIQCGTDTQDIVSAINDAVVNKVDVISLSLGGSACSSPGVDSDALEGQAVQSAIAAGIIVVAASGNSGTSSTPQVESPACDAGVIAVGATALADGTANATGKPGGSPTAPFEYVASYSDYGSPTEIVGSASAWGIVAPGGDPVDGGDVDDLHWIQNIWTSTPYMASSADTHFLGDCRGDYPSRTGIGDCSVLIAGTSMSTPHVAGAAALIISVNPSFYKSPANMKQLLCSTADDIGDAKQGCGRLNVYRAMATALADPAPPAPPPAPPIP